MSSSTSNSSVRSSVRHLSVEALSADQRATANRYVNISSTRGVLVAALVGQAAWDIRPLLLDQGELHLLRFTALTPPLDELTFAAFRTSLERRLTLDTASNVRFGLFDKQLWVKRRFYPSVLLEEIPGSLDRSVSVRTLLTHVASLHEQSIVHGHIALSNVAQSGSSIVLVDHGFATHTPGALSYTHELAPELLTGQLATAASDVFGVANVISRLLDEGAPAEQRSCLEAMLLPEPHRRPSMARVQEVFTPRVMVRMAKPSSASSPLSSGRVIQTRNDSGAFKGSVVPATPYGSSSQLSRPLDNAPAIIAVTEKVPGIPSAPGADQRSAAALEATSSGKLWFAIPVAVALGVIAIGYALQNGWFHSNSIDPASIVQMSSYWSSGQRALAADVATRAVEGDPNAQAVVLEDMRNGTERYGTRVRLLKVAFDPLWSEELSEADKKVVFRLGLASLAHDTEGLLPPSQLHPAVLLALTSDLPLQGSASALAGLNLEIFERLPEPYGAAFLKLRVLRGANVRQEINDGQVRALAHILAGDNDPAAIAGFFNKEHPERHIGELLILLPLLETFPGLADPLNNFLREGDGMLSQRLGWFDKEKLAQWDKVPVRERLWLVAGKFPARTLSTEQLADLLQFPLPGIREQSATRQLQGMKHSPFAATMSFLTGPENKLSRQQNIALVAALEVQGEKSYSFLSAWFDMRPAPAIVVAILATRNSDAGTDPFSVQAARYLKNQEWEAALPQLRKLITNPEMLVRAIAYSKIDSGDPEGMKLLREAAAMEPNRRLREQVAQKIFAAIAGDEEAAPAPDATAVPVQ